jgi:hypothetical protein
MLGNVEVLVCVFVLIVGESCCEPCYPSCGCQFSIVHEMTMAGVVREEIFIEIFNYQCGKKDAIKKPPGPVRRVGASAVLTPFV